MPIDSHKIEEYLEKKGEIELRQAFKAMVGCDGQTLFNSLNPEMFKYNEKENDYYPYRQLLIKRKDDVILIASKFGLNHQPLYDSLKEKGLYGSLITYQELAKLLKSMQDKDDFGLYLNFQASLSNTSEIIFVIRLIVYTLRKLDLLKKDTIVSIKDIHEHIIKTHKEPKAQMLSNYFSVITGDYTEDEKDTYDHGLTLSLGSAFAYLESEGYNAECCIQLFVLNGGFEFCGDRDSNGYIEYMNYDFSVCKNKKAITDNIVKQTCKELGITQKELAELIGYSLPAVKKAVSDNKISEPMQKAIELYLETLELKKEITNYQTLKKALKKALT